MVIIRNNLNMKRKTIKTMMSVQLLWLTLGLSWTLTAYLWLNNKNVKDMQQGFYSPLPSKKPSKKPDNDQITVQKDTFKSGFKYLANMSTNTESTLDISTILLAPWKKNMSNLKELRSNIKKSVHTDLILTQKNVNISQPVTFLGSGRTMNITEEFYRLLPKDSPEHKGPYKRCSIVGNGGILNGSKCGKEIDKADFVIRCNAPPLNGFTKDAGSKTNLTTVNPSLIRLRFGSARKRIDRKKFTQKMDEYRNYIWFPTFTSSYTMSLRVNSLLNKRLEKVKFVHGDPKHFTESQDFWVNSGVTVLNRISSGFYITTTALLFCDEVHLYGFWPFSTDIYNRSTSYHYFEQRNLTRLFHAFNQEFNELARLHSEGILQLHVDDCYKHP
ncbi:alpha-N-acetylneuraminide alpha-2,8-sialyltransferase-like [Antedon mediterranea]|uniref:alpha-N-acetylneuraminide alpha-2,8-sialyltransferase-like n=1 Tax=Antedon mediterranea TaxID=105859 RepID=UPI003AF4854D